MTSIFYRHLIQVEYNYDTMIQARYRRIVLFFGRFLVSFALWDLVLPLLGGRRWARKTRDHRLKVFASAYRSLAVRMGGVLIKVGQFLSSRVDILPIAFTQELEGLQDEVPSEDIEVILQVAEEEYGVPIREKFAWFEEKPLASASFGQVHRARLRSDQPQGKWYGTWNLSSTRNYGDNVVVKIQRPNMKRIIDTDLSALRTVGGWLNRYRPIQKRMNIPALLDEFSRILYEEIDYLKEGGNAEKLAKNFEDRSDIRIPYVIWSHTTKRALTLENVWGIKITDYDAISAAGIDRNAVASRLLNAYLKQIFEDGFFHADPHPGNLFVNPIPQGSSRKVKWELTFVDFGMVGTVAPKLRQGLRELVMGVGTKDTERVIKAYQMMDLLLPNADLDLIRKMEEKAFEQFWGLDMTELSGISFEEMHEFSKEFRQIIYEMPFQVPQNIIFLGRCVGILSGICTGLDSRFNLWDHLAPYADSLIAEEARTNPKFWLGEIEKYIQTLVMMPYQMNNTLQKIEKDLINVHNPELKEQVESLERSIRLIPGWIIYLALFLGGVQLYISGRDHLAIISFSASGVLLLWLFWRGKT